MIYTDAYNIIRGKARHKTTPTAGPHFREGNTPSHDQSPGMRDCFSESSEVF